MPLIPLSYTHRPESLKERIVAAFHTFRNSSQPWRLHTYEDDFKIAAMDTSKLLKHLITATPAQKIFNVLDIGTRDGLNLKHLANQINNDESIPEDIRINIIGIRAEETLYNNPPEEILGKCHILDYNGFNAEFLIEELASRGHADKKFDMIMSLGYMVQLVDPIGTFEQAYSITRPNTGLLLMDGFWIQIEGQPPCYADENTPREQIISFELCTKDSGATFLHHPSYFDFRSFPQFIIKKGNLPLQLPLEYTESILIPVEPVSLRGKSLNSIIVYKQTDLKYPKLVIDPTCEAIPQNTLATWQLSEAHEFAVAILIGDKALYEEIEPCLGYIRPNLPEFPPHATYIGDFGVVERPLIDVPHTADSGPL